jgi:peptidyl-prolyl cis-trans isomerase D
VREARRVIERAMEQLQKGDDFGKIARQYSEGIKAEVGGTWPKLSRGSFAEMRVEDAAWELDEGEFSEIVETETGYYIVRAREVEKGTMVSFEDAQSDIRRAFQDEQLAKLRGEYMRKLYQNATISQPDEFIRLAIERAVERYWR